MLSRREEKKGLVGSIFLGKNIYTGNTGKSLYLDLRTEKMPGLVKNHLYLAEGHVPIFNGLYEIF